MRGAPGCLTQESERLNLEPSGTVGGNAKCMQVPPKIKNRTETGWDLRSFAAVPAPGHTSPQATKYKETIRDEK